MTDELNPTPSQPEETTPAPAEPTPPASTAEAFIKVELAAAEQSLRSTMIYGVILVLVLTIYLGYVTNGFVSNLQPSKASEILIGIAAEQIDMHGDAVVEEVRTRVPAMFEQVPEAAKAQLPVIRENIESRYEDMLNQFCSSTSDKLGQELDKYIDDNKDKVKALLEAGNDPEALAALRPSIKKEVMAYLKEKPDNGPSIDEQITESLKMINDAENRLSLLAKGKNLTPAEKKARHAIAVIANTIDTAEIQPAKLPKLPSAKEE